MTRPEIAAARASAKHFSLALLATGIVAALLPAMAADEPPKEWDGLVRVNSKQIDHLYKLPEANFSGYKRVRLDPIEVEFDKNWKPNESERSPSRRLTNSDLEKIKKTLAEEFRKVFTEELAKNGYPVVDQDDDDVLRVSAAIANLYITAPEKISDLYDERGPYDARG